MIHLNRDKQTTLFYFKTDAGKLPQELSGFWTNEVQAKRALELHQAAVRSNAEKNSAQVRKAKGRTLKRDEVHTEGMIEKADAPETETDSSD